MNQSDSEIHIKGNIASGQGKGAFFVSQQEYIQQFKEKLGFLPYSGTLNITVQQQKTRSIIQQATGFIVHGFQTKDKKFGNVKCIDGEIKKGDETRKIVLILPEKSEYTDTLEIIAPFNIRKELELINGDEVELILRPSN
jgi:riboflavin kinase